MRAVSGAGWKCSNLNWLKLISLCASHTLCSVSVKTQSHSCHLWLLIITAEKTSFPGCFMLVRHIWASSMVFLLKLDVQRSQHIVNPPHTNDHLMTSVCCCIREEAVMKRFWPCFLRCAPGYYGDPLVYGGRCRLCNCPGNLCDSKTGGVDLCV